MTNQGVVNGRSGPNGRAGVVLPEAVRATPGPQVTLGELVHALHERAFGFLLALVGLLSCVPLPPGISSLAGVPILVLGAQLLLGRDEPRLPRRLLALRLPRDRLVAGLERLAPHLAWIERLTRPRRPLLFRALVPRPVGAVLLVLGAYITFPMMFTNIPPAMATVVIAVALIEDDDLLLALGFVGALLALTISTVLAAGLLTALGWGLRAAIL